MTGYGADTWCTDSLVTGRMARGTALVVQALYRRFTTPRGTLRGIDDGDDEFNYGMDLSEYLGDVGTTIAVQALPGLMRGEALKDDRVADFVATAVLSDEGDGVQALTVECAGVLVEEDEEFEFTLAVTDVSVALLGSPS